MFDKNSYTGIPDAPTPEPDAPVIVIIIAIAIGGVITSICIGVVIYLCVRAYKNRGLTKKATDDEEDLDRLNELIGAGQRKDINYDVSSQHSFSENGPTATVKVLPAGG